MNSNTFQDNPSTTDDGGLSYKFGAWPTPTPPCGRSIEHNKYVIDLGVKLDRPR